MGFKFKYIRLIVWFIRYVMLVFLLSMCSIFRRFLWLILFLDKFKDVMELFVCKRKKRFYLYIYIVENLWLIMCN